MLQDVKMWNDNIYNGVFTSPLILPSFKMLVADRLIISVSLTILATSFGEVSGLTLRRSLLFEGRPSDDEL